MFHGQNVVRTCYTYNFGACGPSGCLAKLRLNIQLKRLVLVKLRPNRGPMNQTVIIFVEKEERFSGTRQWGGASRITGPRCTVIIIIH